MKATDYIVREGRIVRRGTSMVKEGPGAGYTVHIEGLEFNKIIRKEKIEDLRYKVEVSIKTGEYVIGAEDYYEDFFHRYHEMGDEIHAKIDGGTATVIVSRWTEDELTDDEFLKDVLEGTKVDIDFLYGAGYVHVDLPNKIVIDHVEIGNQIDEIEEITKINLDAPDLAEVVNYAYRHMDDEDYEDDEDEYEDVVLESVSSSEKDAKALEEFGAEALWFALRVHYWHLNADRNAVHVTLQDLYESIEDKADALLEAVCGIIDRPVEFGKGTSGRGGFVWDKKVCIKEIVEFKESAEKLVKGEDAGIDNILSDICEACDSAIYKLRRL